MWDRLGRGPARSKARAGEEVRGGRVSSRGWYRRGASEVAGRSGAPPSREWRTVTAGPLCAFLLRAAEEPAEQAAGEISQAAATTAATQEPAEQAPKAGWRGGLGLGVLVLQHAGEVAGIDALLLFHPAQGAHHQGGQHGQELAGLSGVDASGVGKAGRGIVLMPAEDVAQDGPADAAGRATRATTAEVASDLVQDAAVVGVQSLVQGRGAAGLRGIVGESSGEHRNGRRDGLLGGRGIEAELLAEHLDAFGAELRA